MQQLLKIRPLSVNTDADELLLPDQQARYLKNYRVDFNQNENLATGTGDGSSAEGANFGTGTPITSSVNAAPALTLPAGINRNIGSYECQETGEIYWMNWNSNSDHGIYRINGLTGLVQQVYVGSCLNFSIDPKYSLKHRIYLKVVYYIDDEGNRFIKYKYLVFTDGNNWHRWVDVETSIATNSFDPIGFPYFKMPPYHDACELINLAAPPPFLCPTAELVPFRKDEDMGKNNNLANRSLQFAYQFVYRDGRATVFSPYSTNLYVGAGGCQELNANSPRCARLTMEAGNPLVEKIRIFFRNCGGSWYVYETLDKHGKCEEGVNFWEREVALPGYNAETNTFVYTFCGDKECGIFSVEDANRIQNDLPLLSFALTPVGDALLACNNLYGYDNFECNSLTGVKVSVGIPGQAGEGEAPCVPRQVNIKVYIVCNGTPVVRIDNENGKVVFGDTTFGSPLNIDLSKDVVFANGKGFTGYFANTPFASIGVNYKVDKDGNILEKMEILNYYDANVRRMINEHFSNGGYFIIGFEFTVEAGIYIFRVAGPEALLTDPDYQRTSTYIHGLSTVVGMKMRQFITGKSGVWLVKDTDYHVKELVIDARNGNVDTWANSHRTLDFTIPYTGGMTRSKALSGYITDTSQAGKKPIEMLGYIVDEGYPDYIRSGWFTDHNGFYFTSVQNGGAQDANVVFWGDLECTYRDRDHYFLRTTHGKRPRGVWLVKQDIAIKDTLAAGYKECNDVVVRGTVTDQDGNGVSSLAVTITRGGSTLTNAVGEFVLRVHQKTHRALDGHKDQIIFSSVGGCPIASADNCTPLAPIDYNPPPNCQCPGPTEYAVTFNIVIKYLNGSAAGLKGGGRYGIGIVGRDSSGRQGFINNVAYLDIPTFLETGVFAPVALNWSIADTFTVPDWVAWLSFYRTKNLNHSTFLQWVGDKIEFINARGETLANADEAVRAKIYITSLFAWNVQNNFSTTVGYQFVQGDVLRIYDNGDGTLFKVDADTAFMDFPILGTNFNQTFTGTDVADQTTDPRSFIIAYDKRLNALKDKCSFWIEIMRPHTCEERELYFEICGSIPVVNGRPQVTSGTLATWDTYYQTRQIHPEGCAFKTFNHPFESPAISDFWGAGCDNLGRITVIDADARQMWYGDDSIKSDDFINTGRVNGLGTWREANRKNFKGQEWGPIVAVHAERSIVAFICQNDWFLTDFNMNFLRATRDGYVLANLENNLSDPHQKIGATYGCELEDNAAIVFDDGLVIWPDRKNANVVLMDYRAANDMASVDCKSYFVEKFRYVTQHNAALSGDAYLSNLIEITGTKDPKYNDYILTFRPRRGHSDDPLHFTNNERETKLTMQETIVFSSTQQKWLGWRGYAPENYGTLRHSATGIEMICFHKGIPYYMNNNALVGFNTFFGVETDQVITVIPNAAPGKVKIFQSVAIESNNVQYFIDKIITNETNSFSYMPLAYWKKKESIWYSEVLRDMNSYPDPLHYRASMLIDGKRMFGTYAMMRLVRNTNYRQAYSELLEVTVRVTGSERSET